jgi:hypothetical protein
LFCLFSCKIPQLEFCWRAYLQGRWLADMNRWENSQQHRHGCCDIRVRKYRCLPHREIKDQLV